MTDKNFNGNSINDGFEEARSDVKILFPKRIGIVFIEEFGIKKPKLKLNFDQIVFSHLFLQLNKYQNLFDFQIVSPSTLNNSSLPNPGADILNWFKDQIELFEEKETTSKKNNNNKNKKYGIDYWIAITSEPLWDNNLFCQGKLSNNKLLWVITSHDWERKYCPPSLFEYLISLIIMCCLNTISHKYNNNNLHQHEVDTISGCIFETNKLKKYRRLSVSNPLLCYKCKEQLKDLDDKLKDRTNNLSLLQEVDNILSKKWMGSLEKRDSPIYNLKKNYKYDIDKHSGFYKNGIEKFKDNIMDNLPQWIVGTLITGIISSTILVMLGIKQ